MPRLLIRALLFTPVLIGPALLLLADQLDEQLRRNCLIQNWPAQVHRQHDAFCRSHAIALP